MMKVTSTVRLAASPVSGGTAFFYQAAVDKHAVTHAGGTAAGYQKYWNRFSRPVEQGKNEIDTAGEACIQGSGDGFAMDRTNQADMMVPGAGSS